MAARSSQPVLALTVALTLGGCVTHGSFPSLAPRPGEGDVSVAEPARPDTIVADDAALRQRIVTLEAQAQEGQGSFDAAYGAAAAAAGRAGSRDSDSWVAAQEAVSRLEAARGATPGALAALDRLSTERADQPTSVGDRALIDAAIVRITQLSNAQYERIAQLRRRLGD